MLFTHSTSPGLHVPAQALPTHVMLLPHAMGLPHVPAALHVWTSLGLAH